MIYAVAILWLLPEQHASFSTVFTTTVNNTGFFGGETGVAFLFFVLPISAILTQYTITGYDASGARYAVPRTPITARMLLTHTAGFGYDFFNEKYKRLAEEHGQPSVATASRAA